MIEAGCTRDRAKRVDSIHILGERLVRELQVKPQTSKELATTTSYSERHVRDVLSRIPGISRKRTGTQILYSFAAAPPEQATEPAPAPDRTTQNESDTESDTKVTHNKAEIVTVTFTMYVDSFRKEPDRKFTIQDFVDQFHAKPEAVRQALNRLSKTGKGAGPVRKVAHGMYQFAPEKESNSLQVLARSGHWKFENLVFVKTVTLGAQGGVVSLSKTIPEQENKAESDTTDLRIPAPGMDCVSHPGFGFPWTLITGHTIAWLDYPNGTEVIRISANGAPPISEDFLIFLIDIMKDYGALKDDSWRCVSLEANIDSRYHRIDGSYSMKVIEGVILKAYQHDYVGRLEIADRRTHGIKEVMDLFRSLTGTFDGQGLIREQQKFEKRVDEQVQMISKKSELAYQVATKERDHRLAAKRPGTGRQTPAPASPSSFLTGSEVKQGTISQGDRS